MVYQSCTKLVPCVSVVSSEHCRSSGVKIRTDGNMPASQAEAASICLVGKPDHLACHTVSQTLHHAFARGKKYK